MSKTIVFCADGTWNSPDQHDDADGTPDPTNVWKLFQRLKGTDDNGTTLKGGEQEAVFADSQGHVQVAKYLHGVGDSDNPLLRMLGGTTGAGIINRIIRGYTFVSRNYEPGAQIVLVGFSRGAYTVRALADFILTKGVLKDSAKMNKVEAYTQGLAAWLSYRVAKLADEERGSKLKNILPLTAYLAARALKPAVTKVPSIKAIGVWDTVGSLGVPSYILNDDTEVLQFVNNELSNRVDNAFHAVAMDELRRAFEPTMWVKSEGAKNTLVQVGFPGGHCDVGGGYANTALSDGALAWMLEQLRPFVNFEDLPLPDGKAAGPAHNEWEKLPWRKMAPATARPFGGDRTNKLPLDQSVFVRLNAPTGYKPEPCLHCPRGVPLENEACCVF